MSRPPKISEPELLLRELADEALPTASLDTSLQRRDRLVRGVRDTIGRSIEQAERRMRWRRTVIGVAVAASFLLLGGALLRDRAEASGPLAIAGIDRVSGTVVLTQDGARKIVGSSERSLHDGDSLQTTLGARARVATSKSSVELGEATELRLSRPSAAEERISLRRGRVDVVVDKAAEAKRAVVVDTPDAEVVVRGTIFDVRVEPSGAATTTHVHVTRGSVWVLSQGVQVALLSEGQRWSSAGGVVEPAQTPATGPAAKEPAGVSQTLRVRTGVAAPPKEAPGPRKPGTLAEENRLYSVAVEARNRGDAARAAELFGELLTTYPQSPLREVAQVERFRSLSRAGQAARAAAEARRYLAEHSDGIARSEARELALEAK
ncbi:MAG TPA: FecR domain-containing protein [Polyangiaceae bacterium]|nr:FecR domain-containing protein [Polyangiaceae bacterium]